MPPGGEAPVLGLYGKLPARADFVRRRLPLSFVTPWDGWLQEAIAHSREDLGDGWLQAYLTSPLWRFALAAGLCGDGVAAGVVMPSVDAVGRHFPLTIAVLLPAGVAPFELPAANEEWFGRIEEIALGCLDQRRDPDRVEAALDDLGAPSLMAPRADGLPMALPSLPGGGLRWELAADLLASLARDLYPMALDQVTRAGLGAYSLWWTLGSDDIPPSFLVFRGLPPAPDFAFLLSERQTRGGLACGAARSGELGAPRSTEA